MKLTCDTAKIWKRKSFKGISLEQKWKTKHENETFEGSKSGGQFMRTVIDYKGQNNRS